MANANWARFFTFGKKIIGVGRNYRDHAAEMKSPVPKEPMIFFKPTTAYITKGEEIVMPLDCLDFHHEIELGVVIASKARRVSEASAMDHVAGYVLALDMTDRTQQAFAKDNSHPWTLAKGIDTSCPIGEFLPREKIGNPDNLVLWLTVNDQERQRGFTKDMIFTIPHLISWISQRITLEPGDLIITGTPSGVGPVKAKDVIKGGLLGPGGDTLTNIEFKVKNYND